MTLLAGCLCDSHDDTVRRRVLQVLEALAKRDEAFPGTAGGRGAASLMEWEAFAGTAVEGHFWETCFEGLRRPQL